MQIREILRTGIEFAAAVVMTSAAVYMWTGSQLQPPVFLQAEAADEGLAQERVPVEVAGPWATSFNVEEAKVWVQEQGGIFKTRPDGSVYEVHLPYAGLHDSDLLALRTFENLERIDLKGNPISDHGLRMLAHPGLKTLGLENTNVTDRGVIYAVRTMPQLENIGLNETAVTDKTVRELSSLDDLRYLYLAETDITEAGVLELHLSGNLSDVNIAKTNVGDEGLKRLAGSDKVRRLWVQDSQVSVRTLRRLQAQNPAVRIY